MPIERGVTPGSAPRFTRRERRLIDRLRTPLAVQRYLNRLPYNEEPGGLATLRSFRGVVRHGCAHCLEAALFAAVVLEQHRYPPLVLSFESSDRLDHVVFVYRHRGRWGSIARSRDPGLHGRLADPNVWKVERMLLEHRHRRIRSSNRRINALRKRYRTFKARFPDRKPVSYTGRDRWA